MALSTDEKQALIELKNQGFSYDEAIGFIATSRTGNKSRVETRLETPDVESTDDGAVADIKAGFSGAKQAFTEGFERQDVVEQRPTAAGRVAGTLGAGFRAAGEAIGSLTGGAIRALPGGTTVMNKVSDVVGSGVEKAMQTGAFQGSKKLFEKLPQGVQQTAGDIGNVAMGAVGIAEPLVAPGAAKALSTGIKTFATAGIKDVGEKGIQTAVKTGLEPEALMQRVARISKGKQTAFEQRAGESVGDYLVNRGIFGDPESITEQLYIRMQTSKGRVDTGLKKVGGVYKNDTVQDALEQLAEREAKVSSTRTPSQDSGTVSTLLKKHNGEGLTLEEVNQVKRLYERNIKLDYLRDNVADGIAKANNIDNRLRDFVEKTAETGGFPTVKALNKETSLAKQLLDDLGAEYAGQAGNNFVSLSDALFLAEAASNPTALAAFGLKKAFSSKSAMSAVARIMAKKRGVQGLPSGEMIEPKLLPAAPEGAPRSTLYATGRPIEVGGETSTGRVEPGITERVPEGTIKRSDSEPKQSPLMRIEDARNQAIYEIETEMTELARAGYRTVLPHDATRSGSPVVAVSSTFPKWVPERLRSKELFDKVWENINNKKAPRSNATQEIELQNIIEDQIEKRMDDILNTTKLETAFSNEVF